MTIQRREPRNHDDDRQPDAPLTTYGGHQDPPIVVSSSVVSAVNVASLVRRGVDDALNVQDVASLIINTMVGSGIYTVDR